MIGIDIINIDRFNRIAQEDFSHWDKVFFQTEWEHSFKAANPAQALAGIFSAKEAVMKAIGDKFMGQFGRIQVNHKANGQPIIKIDDKKQANIHVSISHDQNTVVAVAIKL